MVENNPLSRNISTLGQSELNNNQEGVENFKRRSKKSSAQNCNAPGAMNAYSQYAQVSLPDISNQIVSDHEVGRRSG